MTRNQQILIAVVLGGVLYFVLTRRSQAAPGNGLPGGQDFPAEERKLPAAISDRVMGRSGFIFRYGAEYAIDPALIASMITVESAGRANAFGAAGEIGLMQIIPSTGKWIAGVTEEQLWTPEINISTGTKYLRYCITRKGGNVAAGIAGYNYGPDRVQIAGGRVVAPEHVLRYARDCLEFVSLYQRLFREQLGTFYQNAFPTGRLSGLACGQCSRR